MHRKSSKAFGIWKRVSSGIDDGLLVEGLARGRLR